MAGKLYVRTVQAKITGGLLQLDSEVPDGIYNIGDFTTMEIIDKKHIQLSKDSNNLQKRIASWVGIPTKMCECNGVKVPHDVIYQRVLKNDDGRLTLAEDIVSNNVGLAGLFHGNVRIKKKIVYYDDQVIGTGDKLYISNCDCGSVPKKPLEIGIPLLLLFGIGIFVLLKK